MMEHEYDGLLPPVFVTENGCAYDDAPDAAGRVDDRRRIEYLDGHLRAVGEAIAAGWTSAATSPGRCWTTSSGPRGTQALRAGARGLRDPAPYAQGLLRLVRPDGRGEPDVPGGVPPADRSVRMSLGPLGRIGGARSASRGRLPDRDQNEVDMALTVLVTGASGFVGSHLARALEEEGHDVRAMTRRPERYDGAGTPVRADVSDPDSLVEAMRGVDAAYYLVHSLDSADFVEKDAEAARAFSAAARRPGCARSSTWAGSATRPRTSPAPALAPSGRGPARLGRGPGHRAPRGDRGRPRRHLVGDHPAAGEEPPGDGGAAVGRHPHPADLPPGRGPLPGRRAGQPGRAGPGLRDRRARGAQLPRHAAPGLEDPAGPRRAHRGGAGPHPGSRRGGCRS